MNKSKSIRLEGRMDNTKAVQIKQTALFCVGLILLSVVMITTAWGQQTGQGGAGGMPFAQGGDSGMPSGWSPGGNMGASANINYVPAIYIADGVYLKDKSAPSAVRGGKAGDTSASGLKITSKTDQFNGIYVKGSKSQYTLSASKIELYGNGVNHQDNYGSGAGAVVGAGGTLILKNVQIATNGLVSCAAVATNGSILKVYDSTLRANGGTLPPDSPPLGSSPEAYGPPVGLGITSGTARACNTTNNSKSYYYDSTIIAEGWGALSTDEGGSNGVYLEANNCEVKVIKSGYGTYADGGCEVVINNSRFNVATYGGIAAGSGKIHFNDTNITSGGNCVLIHNVGGASDIATFGIKGGKIETKNAVILIKSANAEITVEGAEMVSKSGLLIQSMINDDKDAPKVNGQQLAGVNATLKKMTLNGNIVHEDPDRGMVINLAGSTLKGSIKNASISLDASSKWTATADSEVTFVDNVDIKTIDASASVTITAVAGKGCALNGSYKLASGGNLNIKTN